MWRAVEKEGEVLDVLVQKRRNKAAALKLLRKLLKNQGYVPDEIVTDGLASYRAALQEPGCLKRHKPGRLRNNNRVENSHLPFRRRERAMLRFRRMRTLQKFASVHASVHNHFPTERHLQDRNTYKTARAAALAEWRGLLAA